MAQLHINDIKVLDNPSNVLSPFKFDITFETFSPLPGTVDWKIIYIGSPSNNQHDQIIDSWDMDDLAVGAMNFQVESNPPNFGQIPQDEIVVSYEKQQFFRVGYYVRNEYDQALQPQPIQPDLQQLNRYIWNEKPIIFRFQIEWVKKEPQMGMDQQMLQKNLEIMGGDPFQQTNGALQQLDQMNYSYGLFGSNGQQQVNQGSNGFGV